MQTPNDYKNGSNRRKVLKQLASAGTGLSILPAVSSARRSRRKRPDLHEVYNEAKRIRQNGGSQEEFIEYLTRNDVNVARQSEPLPVFSNSYEEEPRNNSQNDDLPSDQVNETGGGAVSAQKIPESAVTADMLYIYGNCSPVEAVIDYSVYFDTSPWNFGVQIGDDGKDIILLTWKGYDIINKSWDHNDHGGVEWKDANFQYCSFEFDDYDYCTWGCNSQFSVSVRLRGTQTKRERAVLGKYYHTYQQNTHSGYSVSSNGTVSATFTNSDKKETYGFKIQRENNQIPRPESWC